MNRSWITQGRRGRQGPAAGIGYTFGMKKDNRQIRLDPMEWRDAMRDAAAPEQKDGAAKPVRGPAKKKPASRTPRKKKG
jgi:hypothetical protein